MTVRSHCFGIVPGHSQSVFASWPPGVPCERIRTFGINRIPVAAVKCTRGGPGPLPLTFANARPFRSGETGWLETLLTLFSQTTRLPPPSELQTVMSVPPRVSSADRVRCREIGVRCGWSNLRMSSHDVTLAFEGLGRSSIPVTALIVFTDFDGTDLCLVTVLKGTVRLRGCLRLVCLGHHVADEIVLASCLAHLEKDLPHEDASCVALWSEVRKLRHQLTSSAAGAIELIDPNWALEQPVTLSLARDDLWPGLRTDVCAVIDAAKDLVKRHAVSGEKLDRIVLAGGGVLSWDQTRAAFAAEWSCPVSLARPHAAAIGAAMFAAEPEDFLSDLNAPADETWSRAWETLPSRASAVQVGINVLEASHATFASDPVPIERDFRSALDTIWSYLRGVGSENPERARTLLSDILEKAELLRTSFHEPEPPLNEVKQNAEIALAELVLRNGDLKEAVSIAHFAQSNAPDDSIVFRQMIDVHIQASDACQDHVEALNWLLCAHSHDQNCKRVHQQLADRYRLHARALEDSGMTVEALDAAQRSLVFEPFNEGGRALAKRLSALTHAQA